VRDTGDEADASIGDRGLGREGASGLLLQHVEHRLQGHDVAVAQGNESFVDPADGRTERNAELEDLAFGAKLLQLLPQRVAADRLDARVVELVEVDVIGAEPAQRSFELLTHRRGLPVVRSFGLARILPRRVDVVAALRGEHDVVALGLQYVGEQLLTEATVAVDGRGVDEVDAGIECSVEQPLLVLDDSPPVAGERPDTEPDLGDLQVASTKAAVSHSGSFRLAAFVTR
jgi:hypothetical protein